jgi:hypothetical protein
MGEKNAQNDLVGKPERKRSLGNPDVGWEDHFKIHLTE